MTKTAKAELEVLDKILPVLEEGRPARAVELSKEEKVIAKNLFLLTTKPTIYAANVDEESLANPDANPHVLKVKEHAASENAEVVVICAKLEAELVALDEEERNEYLKDLGVESSGVGNMIKSAYKLLGLMSFLTAGKKEVPRVDDSRRHESTESGGRNPFRHRTRFYSRRNRFLRRFSQLRFAQSRQRKRFSTARRQRICDAGRRCR